MKLLFGLLLLGASTAHGASTAVESSLVQKGKRKAAKADLVYVCHGGKVAKIIVNSTGPGSFAFSFDKSKCATEWSSES